MYIFPLLARFNNTIRAMFKNALMIGMRFLLCTALIAFIYFIMAVIVIRIFTPAIIFGEGLCALLCSYLLSNILLLCEGKMEESQEEVMESEIPETSESGDRKWSVKDVHGIAKLGSIAGELLDVVLMDQTAFDIMSKNGYLCNIEELLLQEDPDLYEELQCEVTTNTVIIEDNAVEASLNSSIAYEAATDEYPMAVDISSSDLVLKEEFNGILYLGIISNAPHKDTAIDYLRYLTDLLP